MKALSIGTLALLLSFVAGCAVDVDTMESGGASASAAPAEEAPVASDQSALSAQCGPCSRVCSGWQGCRLVCRPCVIVLPEPWRLMPPPPPPPPDGYRIGGGYRIVPGAGGSSR
jgi:hypothetical protein